MTKAVLFDFYGTLARAVGWGPRVEDVLTSHGLTVDPDARARWTAEGGDGVDHSPYSGSRDGYVAWERERLRRLVDGCGADSSAVDRVVDDLYRAMKSFTLAAYAEAPGVLAELRARGLTVAVCSNWDWDLDVALEQSGLDDLIDVPVTSAQAGARKPHPLIYRITLERCAIEPSEAVFVGDTWLPDVEGPLAAGMRPVHVWRPEEGREPPPAGDGVPSIPDLGHLLALV